MMRQRFEAPRVESAPRPVAGAGQSTPAFAKAEQPLAEVEWRRMKILHSLERLFLAAGLTLVLVYVSVRVHALVMYQAGLFSFTALRSIPPTAQADPAQLREADFSLRSGERIKAYAAALATKLGTPLAVLSIPKLRLEVPVFEGTDKLTLNRGAGRIVGTAIPGEQGNMGIAGHRDGLFRALKDIRMGDRIELAVPGRKLMYTVDNITVVSPSDVSVLQPRSRPSLTLVTCYPFYFLGEAPLRYVVQASLLNPGQSTISETDSEFQKFEKEKTQ